MCGSQILFIAENLAKVAEIQSLLAEKVKSNSDDIRYLHTVVQTQQEMIERLTDMVQVLVKTHDS